MINIDHLQYFFDAAKFRSIAEAARRHRVSPSAVSQAIRALERHFDLVLTKHEREFALTSEGEVLIAQAPELFAAARAIDISMQETRNECAGKVNFATQQSIAHALLPNFFKGLSQTHPRIQPHVRFGTTATTRNWLRDGEIELVMSLDNVAFDDFARTLLLEGEFVLIRAAANSLDHDETSRAFILTEDTREKRIFCREYARIYNHPVPIAMQVSSWSVIRRMVESGLGTGLVPDYILNEDDSLLERLELGIPKIPYCIAAYFHSRRRLSKLSRVFLDELEKQLAKAP